MAGTLSIAISGLRAMQTALDISSNNVANAQTAGYRRQEVYLQNRQTGGVSASLRTTFDALTATRISVLDGFSAETEAKSGALTDLTSSLSASATGLSKAMNTMRESLGTAANNPNNPVMRDIIAVNATALAGQATSSLSALDNQLQGLNQQQSSTRDAAVAKVNELVSLNRSANQFPDNPQIRNQQAQAGRELAELVGGEIKFLPDGKATFSVNGSFIVNGLQEPKYMPIPAQVGGKLGGLQASTTSVQAFRGTLATTLNSFTNALNNVNTQGFDATGAAGNNIFSFDGTDMKFVGNASGLALDSAGGLNGDNARNFLGLKSVSNDVAGLASKAGAQSQIAKTEFSSRAADLRYTEQEQATHEGVNLDEETINLKTAQQLYAANAKVIQTYNEMFGTLLNIVA